MYEKMEKIALTATTNEREYLTVEEITEKARKFTETLFPTGSIFEIINTIEIPETLGYDLNAVEFIAKGYNPHREVITGKETEFENIFIYPGLISRS